MKIRSLILSVIIFHSLFLHINLGSRAQDIADFQWKKEIELTWKELNENRKKKYTILEVQGNPSAIEINRLDGNIHSLESKFEMLMDEGVASQFRTTVIDSFPDKQIKFPGLPKGEEVLANNPEGIKRGAIVLIVNPAYPMEVKEKIDDAVKVEVVINKAGKVANAKCISGNSKLYNAALSAISKWRFQPSTIDSKPVNISVTVTLAFKK
jgi:TonB family protein